MIECEICGVYFHADEIRRCPNTDCIYDDLCEGCYNSHVLRCLSEYGDEEDEEDDEEDDYC